MALPSLVADRLVARGRLRGRALAGHTQALVAVMDGSPIDLAGVLGPVLLLGQAYARATCALLAWAMGDPGYPALSLDQQGSLARLATQWGDLRATLGSLAFARRLPRLAGITSASVPAIRFGANAAGVEIASRLEQLANVAGLAGITPATWWQQLAGGRVALGRMLLVDLALTRDYDFDVLAEGLVLLAEMAPLVPDAPALLAGIAQNMVPGYRETPAARALATRVSSGLTLSVLANTQLGNADLWPLIAAYNGLRYPYISDDPTDQLGPVQGTKVLAEESAQGTSVLTLLDVLAVYPDERLVLDYAGSIESVLITAVDRATNEVTLAAPLARDYPVTTVLTLYAPVYDVWGRVLQTGDDVFIPILTGGAGPASILSSPALATDRLYGIDVAVDAAGRLAIADGDITLARGAANLKQALGNRFKTPRGSLLQHPLYGCGLEAFIGFRDAPFFNFLAMVESQQTVLSDPRVIRVERFQASVSRDVIDIDFTAITTGGETFPSVRLAAAFGG